MSLLPSRIWYNYGMTKRGDAAEGPAKGAKRAARAAAQAAKTDVVEAAVSKSAERAAQAARAAAASAAEASERRTGRRRRRSQTGPTSKRTISFDSAVLVAAEKLAESEAQGNLSAVVNDAVAHLVRLREFGELLADFDRELGPVPAEVGAAVEAEWQD